MCGASAVRNWDWNYRHGYEAAVKDPSSDSTTPATTLPSTYTDARIHPPAGRYERRSSLTLFDHFVTCTIPNLAVRRGPSNPWGSLILAYAQSHEMLLHALLAVSSAHIRAKAPETSLRGYNHYGLAMRGLKYGLTRYVGGDDGSLLPLVITAFCLALYEVRRNLADLCKMQLR